MTTLALQTERWQHVSAECQKQFRKALTEHTCRAGLLFGHLSHGSWFRDVRDLLTAWPQPGSLGQPDSFGDCWKWCDR